MTNEQTYKLPARHEPYIDKYFLRSKQVLQAEGINPWVKAQAFIRKGPGKAYGIDEALAILEKYSDLTKHNGKVYALKEGADYAPKDTLMLIEAPIQDIIDIETMYLGVLSAETTKANDHHGIDLNNARETMAKVTMAAGKRPVAYFGARHWRFDEDAAITRAAYEGGAASASTDIGAETFGQKGMGTTPHVLENIMAWKYGYEGAVPEAMIAFDKVIDKNVARIILVDYRNKEITDTLATAKALGNNLAGIRIDTCGENVGEGAIEKENYAELKKLIGKKVEIPAEDKKYWFGKGVTVTGVYAAKKALEENGYENLKIWLSSGFACPDKTGAFVRAEELLEKKLFDGLGVGQIFRSRTAKMDIVAVGENPDNFVPIAKAGRRYNHNPKLELRLGGKK
jgi:nicotinate phosphoribosyltransferase